MDEEILQGRLAWAVSCGEQVVRLRYAYFCVLFAKALPANSWSLIKGLTA